MRVIGGRFGGRSLQAPRGRATRPTPERVREALFSILGPLDDLRVLDLFAGSGALGIEALSRGAARVTLVDSSQAAVATIRRNVASLESDGELGAHAEVRRQPAGAFLQQAREAGRQYDLVFLDPPYGLAPKLGPDLSAALVPVLAPAARVISESDRRAPLELSLLTPRDERRYGDTLIRIYSHDPHENRVALGSDGLTR